VAAAVGDLFVIHDTGAHSHSMGFQYNGKLRAPELLLRSSGPGAGSVQLIRARESLSYLFGNTVLPLDLLQALPAAAATAYPYGRQEAGGSGSASGSSAASSAAAAAGSSCTGSAQAASSAEAAAAAGGAVRRAGGGAAARGAALLAVAAVALLAVRKAWGR
jgi:hypothetical protein